MRNPKYHIYLTPDERRTVINSLIDLRNELISRGKYIKYIEDNPFISAYTITNGTIRLPDDDIRFLEDHHINVGFSIDGNKELHDYYRCNSFDSAVSNVEHYKSITGHYPTFNATVGKVYLNTPTYMGGVIIFFRKMERRTK